MSKKLNRYFKHQFAEIKTFFQRVNANITDEDIHKVRLSIKKIKALFMLVNAIVPSFRMHKMWVPFEALFDHAAKVREAQLQYNLLTQLPAGPVTTSYRTHVNRQASRAIKELTAYCDDTHWQALKAKAKKAAKKIATVSTGKANRFFRKHKKKFHKAFKAKPVDEEELHDTRKAIKDLRYLKSMLQIKSSNDITDSFQELIGRWHDKSVLLNGLQRFRARKPLSAMEKQRFHHAMTILREKIQHDVARIRNMQKRLLQKL
jgi:CHAD domain-containing protein